MKQVKNLKKHENQFDKERDLKNFRSLSKKITAKPSNFEHLDRQDLHLIRKNSYSGHRGPGTYSVNERDTSFDISAKREQHQCFNTTAIRFPDHILNETAKESAVVGPGSYDVVKDIFNRSLSKNKTYTAAFLTKRPENMFGIKDIPGPQEYSVKNSVISTGKSWNSNM